MTVLHVPDISQGHKFEYDPEVTCAETVTNSVCLVVNVGKDIIIPLAVMM
jgi:hypothetical protein